MPLSQHFLAGDYADQSNLEHQAKVQRLRRVENSEWSLSPAELPMTAVACMLCSSARIQQIHWGNLISLMCRSLTSHDKPVALISQGTQWQRGHADAGVIGPVVQEAELWMQHTECGALDAWL